MTPDAHATRTRYVARLKARDRGLGHEPIVSEFARPSFVPAVLAGVAVAVAATSWVFGVVFL